MVRRTEKQLAHKIDNLLANHFGVTFGETRDVLGEFVQKRLNIRDQANRLKRLMLDDALDRGRINVDANRFHIR